jgi:hypothetical protein
MESARLKPGNHLLRQALTSVKFEEGALAINYVEVPEQGFTSLQRLEFIPLDVHFN